MILLKQADVYAPEHLGIKDVLVCGGKIEAVGDNLEGGTGCQVIDAKGMRLTPGLIDRHVHVTGGGGEGSFHTRTPQIELSSFNAFTFANKSSTLRDISSVPSSPNTVVIPAFKIEESSI